MARKPYQTPSLAKRDKLPIVTALDNVSGFASAAD